MSKTYEMPPQVALALTTERIEFLASMSDHELQTRISVQLIRDLIEDRVKLRAEVVKYHDRIEQCTKAMASLRATSNGLQDYLDGRDTEEIESDSDE